MLPQMHAGDVIPPWRYILAITNRCASNLGGKPCLLLFLIFLSLFIVVISFLLQYSKADTARNPSPKQSKNPSPLHLKGPLQTTSPQYTR